ncbi:hypothetical protein [Thermodesulfovibrio yellowstonii]|uniref:hypothetical protein n=1 Tax=Thermodesulfovibrio yellowstonii TaxID=28262 RepID=UPI0003F80E8D|nr:hypothetical protein [Thermodesulfovibrio islandicus]
MTKKDKSWNYCGNYRYKLQKLFGWTIKGCEVCGDKNNEDVYIQTEERKYFLQKDIVLKNDTIIKAGWRWTRHGCISLYGHKECLIKARKGVTK